MELLGIVYLFIVGAHGEYSVECPSAKQGCTGEDEVTARCYEDLQKIKVSEFGS